MTLLALIVGMYLGAGFGSLFLWTKMQQFMYGDEAEPLDFDTKIKFILFWFNVRIAQKQ